MVKHAAASTLVALLFSLATTHAAVVPLESRDLQGQWNAILNVGKNSDLSVKELCRGVLAPVTVTETVTLPPKSTVISTKVQDVTISVTDEVTEKVPVDTITTVDSTTTKTTTSTETSFETITVIGTKPTDEAQEVAVKRDTTAVVKVKFDLLYKVAPEFVRGVCRGIAQPNTVKATTTAYSAAPTATTTVNNLVTARTTKTVSSFVANEIVTTKVAVVETTLVVPTAVTVTVYEAPRVTTYKNPLAGKDARPVAKFPDWDGIAGGFDPAARYDVDSDCVKFCADNNPGLGGYCGWVFFSSGRGGFNCYPRERYGISEPARAAQGDLDFGAAIYFLGTCKDARDAGAPDEALNDCLDSVNE